LLLLLRTFITAAFSLELLRPFAVAGNIEPYEFGTPFAAEFERRALLFLVPALFAFFGGWKPVLKLRRVFTFVNRAVLNPFVMAAFALVE